jgi:ribosomal protein S16
MATIVERYKRGQIYTIRNFNDNALIYVGSTIEPLPNRFYKHKRDCKSGKRANRLYNHIINNDWSDWYIEFYEYYPCNNKQELSKREGEVIRLIGSINTNKTINEYHEENAEKIKEEQRKYYIENAEKIKERVRKYQSENAEKIREVQRKYREENAEKIKAYREKNAEKIKAHDKERKIIYRRENADKIRLYELKRQQKRHEAKRVAE